MKPEKLRNLLKDEMRNNPRGSETQIRRACWNRVAGDPALVAALFDYWFGNSYRDFTIAQFSSHSSAVLPNGRSTGAIARDRISAVAAVKEQMKRCLMDHELSDGTLLRHATFRQCGTEGNWLVAISKCGVPSEVVGKKLTEADLANLLLRFVDGKRSRRGSTAGVHAAARA